LSLPTMIDRVAVVVPVLNEERYGESCLRALLRQAAEIDADVLVFDGGSTDATREVVARLQKTHPRLALHDNPGRLQSAAVNLAARIALPDVIVLVRADAHAGYSHTSLQPASERSGRTRPPPSSCPCAR
jgi:succinoglycan biosynthesis protein ExoA